ncbi:MAG: long-chain fatty acid--CoA ligase [Treponema sp.]|jgi:long-chain acyl-CoA synthetase|nr:long-chain fatty acid--CoA ligase [Treponema sp.]
MLRNVETLGELCLAGAEHYKSRKVLELSRGDRLLETVNFRTLAQRSLQLAGLFHSLGLERGSRIMILAENRPQWPMAVFGAALAGMVSLPAVPRPPAGREAGEYFRELGREAGVKALCVTEGTEGLAAGVDSGLPRIYLDSPGPYWTGIRAAMGGLSKWLPLARPALPKTGGLPQEGGDAVLWPDGTRDSHRELLSLADQGLRLFPRDRLISVSPLAEKGAFVLAVLALVSGGASLSLTLPETEHPETEQMETSDGSGDLSAESLLRAVELLRPTVLIGDGSFLEAVYRGEAAPIAEGPLGRNLFTRPAALRLGGRRFIKALGGNLRYFGVTGPALRAELEKVLRGVHLPREQISG